MYVQLEKVNRFYENMSAQQNESLKLLVESVKASRVLRVAGDSSGGVVMTPTVTKRKSAAVFIVTSIQSKFSRKHKDEKTNVFYDAPDEDLEEYIKFSDERIRESDSVQRSLVDQYRTTKLLHNFSIMNYTGFIKIAKKHDKTFPQYKGKYKDTVCDSNVCNEGKDMDILGLKTEQLYADWFCGGNMREALAQMLPKRGDGLQMDWSQLR
jgi:SPX domain